MPELERERESFKIYFILSNDIVQTPFSRFAMMFFFVLMLVAAAASLTLRVVRNNSKDYIKIVIISVGFR